MIDDAGGRAGALVAIDWGTTSFRAWLMESSGAVVDRVRTADGTLSVSDGADSPAERARAFEETFRRLCGPWRIDPADTAVLCAGMVGSNHGWREAEYLVTPAALGDLAHHLTRVDAGGLTVHIVPGLRVSGTNPDVMRGEEVQIVGTLALASTALETVVLPGTHSKWVRMSGARVAHFTTTMTGELFGLLMRDSILSRLAAPPRDTDATDAFVRGLDAESERGDELGLPALLFTARTLVMAGRLDPAGVADYVSGLLVGADVRHALRGMPAQQVAVCGSAATAARYRLALERAGRAVHVVDESAAAVGLWQVAADAGLVARRAYGAATRHAEQTSEETQG